METPHSYTAGLSLKLIVMIFLALQSQPIYGYSPPRRVWGQETFRGSLPINILFYDVVMPIKVFDRKSVILALLIPFHP